MRQFELREEQFKSIIKIVDDLLIYLDDLGEEVMLSDVEQELNSLFSEGVYDPNAYANLKEILYPNGEEILKYQPQAVLSMSNFGGISIMTDPEDGDYLYYQYYEDEPVLTKVLWDLEREESRPYFKIEEERYYLDEFMRVDY